MSAGSQVRFNLFFALSVILLIMLVLAAKRNADLRRETGRLHVEASDLGRQLDSAGAARDKLREEAGRFDARLAEATNVSSASLTAAQAAQNVLHQKLRAEIARLSGENVLKDTQMDVVRAQNQELHEIQNKTESSYRNTQTALTATSNQVNQIRASDADKAARLAQREQELAAKATELAAKTTELATAKNAAAQAAAAQAAAEQNAKTAQAQTAAGQAELTALKARVAELEADKAKAAVPPPVIK